MRTADLRAAGRGRGVSDRAVFGDFTGAARQQLGPPATLRTAAVRGGHVPEIRHSLLRLLLVMSRYVQDITPQPVRPPSLGRPPPAGWDRAGLEAREALRRALAGLYGDTLRRRRPGVQAGSELARRLDAAALSLTYGRDLLHTHLAHGPRGGVRYQLRMGEGRHLAANPPGAAGRDGIPGPPARAPGGRPGPFAAGPGQPRSAPGSDGRVPLAADHGHLHPPGPARGPSTGGRCGVAARCPRQFTPAPAAGRRHPGSQQPARAVIDAAERARHAAWLSAAQPPWPPGMTVSSLRQVAAANTFTSRHCELLLRSLATPASGLTGEAGTAVPAAAEAAGQARVRWLGIAHALDQITTSSQEQFTLSRGRSRRPRAVDRPPRARRPGLESGQQARPRQGTDGEPGSRARRSRPHPGRGA